MRKGQTFWDWGIPTPVSVKMADVGLPIIATGGIRDGQDVVKALSLGAISGGMAIKLLKAASRGYEPLTNELGHIIEEIRAALFLSGAVSARDMGVQRSIMLGRTGEIWKNLRK